MKLIAYTAAAALALAPMAGMANDQAPIVQTQQTAGLPDQGGIAQAAGGGVFGGIAPELLIFAGFAAVGVAGIVAVAASSDDSNTSGTQ